MLSVFAYVNSYINVGGLYDKGREGEANFRTIDCMNRSVNGGEEKITDKGKGKIMKNKWRKD